ncbi:MAG: endonuclease Q family protein [Candidatus Micrarchaeales archaeon]|jgi:uncharacterized protein (TIGR00375 family)
MDFVVELHPHSKYAAACSDQLTLENMATACEQKGIQIIGTADFTHPLWFKDIKQKLEDNGSGLYKLKGSESKTRFLLTSEMSIIFPSERADGKGAGMFDRTGATKRFHNCVIAPSIEVVEQINNEMSKFGKLALDGRPMLTMRASEFVEILHNINKDIFVFPAHAYTPWFGIFGSMSGFDSIEEAYEDQAMHIHAFETGLSSDPAMSWRISKLDKYAILSGSDAHSLPKLGREATVFDLDEKNLSNKTIVDSIKNKKIKYTIEFYPEEGKYHFDGHRKCNVSLSPEEAKKYNNICPVCRKPLTLGVMHRINALADREPGYVPKGAAPFVHAIPLLEVLAFISGKTVYSSYVKSTYEKLIEKFGTEMNVLLRSKTETIAEVDKELSKAIENIRQDRVRIKPGYDGVFGIIDVLNASSPEKKGSGYGQKTLS